MGELPVMYLAYILPWLAILFLNPRILTVIVVFLTLFQLNWFTRYYGFPHVFNRIALALACLLAVRMVLEILIQRKHPRDSWVIIFPVLYLSVFFLVLVIISNIYNQESMLLGLYELRYYFIGLVVCMSLYFYFHEKLTFEIFKRNFVWLGLSQFPFSIVKWFTAGGGQILSLDSITGTFSGYGELVACQMITIGIVLYEQFVYKKNIINLNNYIIIIIIIIPLLLSKSRTATILICMIFLFVWILSTLRNKNFAVFLKHMVLVFLITITSLTLFYFFFWKINYDLTREFSTDYIYNYIMRDSIVDVEKYDQGADPSMGRIRAVVEAIKLIRQAPFNIVFGYGSGAVAEASFLNRPGQYFESVGPLAGIGRNQYSKILVELGLAGLCGFILFFFILYRRLKFFLQNLPSIVDTYKIIILVLIITSMYTITLGSFFFSIVLAYFLAMAQVEYDRKYANG